VPRDGVLVEELFGDALGDDAGLLRGDVPDGVDQPLEVGVACWPDRDRAAVEFVLLDGADPQRELEGAALLLEVAARDEAVEVRWNSSVDASSASSSMCRLAVPWRSTYS
jgi:hypothetical protein